MSSRSQRLKQYSDISVARLILSRKAEVSREASISRHSSFSAPFF